MSTGPQGGYSSGSGCLYLPKETPCPWRGQGASHPRSSREPGRAKTSSAPMDLLFAELTAPSMEPAGGWAWAGGPVALPPPPLGPQATASKSG